MTQFQYYQPTKLTFGAGEIQKIGQLVAQYGKRCLVVSEPIFDAVKPAYDCIFALLVEQGIEVTHFDGVVPNPPTTVVELGRQIAVSANCDVVLAIGGGSSIDTAKIISAAIKAESLDWAYWFATYDSPFGDIQDLPAQVVPLIAVPTTSGTGSQVTQAAVITDIEQHAKLTLFHPEFFPCEALIDPELMLTLPPRMTAMTGFDAFSHAFESFTGTRPSPFVDAMALEAMKLVVENLPNVIDNGADLVGRCELAKADTLGGISLANGGAGAPHPLGEILGSSKTNLPHGLTLAVVYPAYVQLQWRKQPERFAQVAELFGAVGSIEEKAQSLAALIVKFLERIGLESNLTQVGVNQEDVLKLEPAFCFDLPLTSGDEMKEILHASLV
ncbi:alcohol dehydrogenase [Photobacterium sp. NCIMB 13483]|uniref:Alcohol dehydrogenase n=1 Tax=Photobacterium piscicola TaxID=1378299 RepID=A0A1T5I5K8_9GAMM|nr:MULTISPECIES: iron-containing alcohol dehydrogenase [Photobacterium]PST87365.1 alcohol dehydrogenase [Photobacterium sp. NCIMB 13483]SKC34223.1 Alcohol dehydrogenase [Photobacterium piscicola]